MTRRIALIIAATLLVAGLAGCGDDDDETTTEDTEDEAPAEEEEGAAGTLEIVGKEFSFEAPSEVEGGVVEVTFSNEGTTAHEANILGVGDTEVDQVLEDFGGVLEGGPIPDYLVGAGGFFEVAKGEEQTATQTLPAGEYLIVCSLDTNANEDEVPEGEEREPHYARGMVLPFTVTGEEEVSVDDLPEASAGVITAQETSADSYTFEVDAVQAGDTLNFVNAEGNEQIHFMNFQVFEEGTTEEEAVKSWEIFNNLEEGQEPPPGTALSEPLGDTSVFNPGLGTTFEPSEPLESGRVYSAACFVQDRSGGPPHAIAQGMIKVFTVE